MFVTRGRHEAVQHDLNRHIVEQTRRADRAEERAAEWYKILEIANADYRDLLAKYHALRLAGASIPEPTPVVQLVPKRENDRVTEVIADIAESNAKLRTRLHAFARKQRAENVDDDAIIQELFNWKEDDGGVPE